VSARFPAGSPACAQTAVALFSFYNSKAELALQAADSKLTSTVVNCFKGSGEERRASAVPIETKQFTYQRCTLRNTGAGDQ